MEVLFTLLAERYEMVCLDRKLPWTISAERHERRHKLRHFHIRLLYLCGRPAFVKSIWTGLSGTSRQAISG